MSEAIKLSRRAFLVQSSVAGAGLLLGFHLPAQRKLAAATLEGVNADQPVEVNAWIEIHPDNSVLIRVARSEMGQGIFTALPMLVAMPAKNVSPSAIQTSLISLVHSNCVFS